MLFCQPSCKHFAWEPPLLHRLAANYKNNVSFWTVFFVKLFLWPGELQYWQACRKKFSKMLAKNWSMSQFSEKIMSFSKKIRSENVFMATYYAVLTTSSENFRQKANKFSLDVRGWYFYCEKKFSLKFSNAHAEFTFPNTAGKILTENVPLNTPNWWKNI